MPILGFYSEFYRKEAILGKFSVVSKYKMLKIIPKVRVNTLEVEKITLELSISNLSGQNFAIHCHWTTVPGSELYPVIAWKSQIGTWLYIMKFDPGMSLNHVLMIFSESWDDFRWNMLFYKIFSTFMVPEGYLGENTENDSKITPKKWDFPIKWP